LLPAKFTNNKLDEEILLKAIRFVEQHISDTDLNGDRLCKELGISKTVLYTKLKTITGQTVNEFIRIIRLKKSVDLLMEGRMNITQISIEMGFNSASYFTKSFTAHFGFSPKEYLLKQKAENDL
jgi:AraC-like DNA-binding protein